jgi:putative flippase GtrA
VTRDQVARFCTYACVGAAGTVVQYLVLAVLVSTHLLGPAAASGLGAVGGALVNYLLNYRFTFRSTGAHRTTAPRFLVVAAAGVGLNSALMLLLADQLRVPWMAAQLMTTACVLALTYSANSVWSFRSRTKNDA